MTDNETGSTVFDIAGNQAFTETVLLTSRDLGWQGFLMETRLHPAGEFQYEPSNDYLISLHLGTPICIERGWSGGRVRREQIEYGAAIVVPAGQPSLWRHTDPSHFLNIHLSAALLDRAAELLALEHTSTLIRTSLAPFHDPHIEHIAMLLRLEMEAGVPNGSLYAEMLANALSVYLLQRESNQARLPVPAPPEARRFRVELRRAVTYIQENLATDLSLEAIAREAGMSTYHFAHVFAQEVGITPHQYVIQARIERAKVLIARDGLPLADAAHLVGFSDQSHFTRKFKRLVGTTPHVFATDANRKIVL
ncbi:MAG: AraC family transcriptional regulator [Chthonomonadaceae bacterium]|nr:AraC family transcriptional regulator [Chthonomonadaceae bacterium]